MGLGAGQIVYDDDLALIVAAVTPVEVTVAASIGTAATNFAINDVRVVTALNGLLINIDLYLNATAAGPNTAGTTSGQRSNIGDTLCFTITNTAYRPAHVVQCVYDTGTYSGFCVINTDGTVTLRTSNIYETTVVAAFASGANLRISATYIRN